MHIIDLIGNIVENIKTTANIVGITDNGNGSYNIYCDVTGLSVNSFITISNTPNFNGDYKISFIGVDYFAILETAGKTITTFGSLIVKSPYYHYAEFLELANYLTVIDNSVDLKYQKFPLILLRLNLGSEKRNQLTNQDEISNIAIFIIGETQSSGTSITRHTNEMPILRAIEKDFMFALMQSQRIHSDMANYGREELLNVSPANVNTLTNAIMINLNGLKYSTKEC